MPDPKTLDQAVLRKMHEGLQEVGKIVDLVANHLSSACGRRWGWVVLLFDFDGEETAYLSNANRADMVKFLRESADVLENQGDVDPPWGTKFRPDPVRPGGS